MGIKGKAITILFTLLIVACILFFWWRDSSHLQKYSVKEGFAFRKAKTTLYKKVRNEPLQLKKDKAEEETKKADKTDDEIWNKREGTPVLELFSKDPEGFIIDDPDVKLSLKGATDKLYEFFLRNGPETGIVKVEMSKEEFLKQLHFLQIDYGIAYEFEFLPPGFPRHKKYRITISGMDGSILCISYPSWLTLEYEGSIEEIEEYVNRTYVPFEKGKEIALRFIERNHLFFKSEEYDLVKCKIQIYNSSKRKSIFYDYEWQRKEKLPGYYYVVQDEIRFSIDPKTGLIDSYTTPSIDRKIEQPPRISKEEAFKMAEARLPPNFPRKFPEEWGIPEPNIYLGIMGVGKSRKEVTLAWQVYFYYAASISEDKPPLVESVGRRCIIIDAYSGEILEDTGGDGQPKCLKRATAGGER